jgi:excinuclease UvrABC nuclease subunit
MSWFKDKRIKEEREFRKWEKGQQQSIREEKNKLEMLRLKAEEREQALDYTEAARIWDQLGEIEEAARIRKLMTEQSAIKVNQKVVHGDEISKTEIRDSVLNKSNVGGGSSKMKELRELKEMFDSGFISKEEMEKMKKEILGK